MMIVIAVILPSANHYCIVHDNDATIIDHWLVLGNNLVHNDKFEMTTITITKTENGNHKHVVYHY